MALQPRPHLRHIGCLEHDVPGGIERHPQHLPQRGFVFDEQHRRLHTPQRATPAGSRRGRSRRRAHYGRPAGRRQRVAVAAGPGDWTYRIPPRRRRRAAGRQVRSAWVPARPRAVSATSRRARWRPALPLRGRSAPSDTSRRRRASDRTPGARRSAGPDGRLLIDVAVAAKRLGGLQVQDAGAHAFELLLRARHRFARARSCGCASSLRRPRSPTVFEPSPGLAFGSVAAAASPSFGVVLISVAVLAVAARSPGRPRWCRPWPDASSISSAPESSWRHRPTTVRWPCRSPRESRAPPRCR